VEIEVWIAVDQQAEHEEDDGSAQRVEDERLPGDAPGEARGGGEDDGDADQKKKDWKDEIGWGEAVPGGVFEGPVGVGSVAVVVDEDHEGDGEAAQDVQREEACMSIIKWPDGCARHVGSLRGVEGSGSQVKPMYRENGLLVRDSGLGGFPESGGGTYNLDALTSSPAYVLKGHFDAFYKSSLL
jgi:hypothetical protein